MTKILLIPVQVTVKSHVRVVIDWPAQVCKGVSLKNQPVKVVMGVLNPSTAQTVLKVTASGRRAGPGRDGDVVNIQLGSRFSPSLNADSPFLVLFERPFRVDVGVEITPRSFSTPFH